MALMADDVECVAHGIRCGVRDGSELRGGRLERHGGLWGRRGAQRSKSGESEPRAGQSLLRGGRGHDRRCLARGCGQDHDQVCDRSDLQVGHLTPKPVLTKLPANLRFFFYIFHFLNLYFMCISLTVSIKKAFSY